MLQGSFCLPAAVADDLHAMQEHGELKAAIEQLSLMFQQVCKWRKLADDNASIWCSAAGE